MTGVFFLHVQAEAKKEKVCFHVCVYMFVSVFICLTLFACMSICVISISSVFIQYVPNTMYAVASVL